jgi:hypothetical protein
MNTIKAAHMGWKTMIGVCKDVYPLDNGNCFSVYTKEGDEYKIVNFSAENLEQLEKMGLSWPIDIIVLKGHTAVINDKRIGDRWYLKEFCEICCPTGLLPITQQLKNKREEEREGTRDEKGRVTLYTLENPQFP